MKLFYKILILCLIISCKNKNSSDVSIYCKTDEPGDAILIQVDPFETIMDTTSIKNGKFSFNKNLIKQEWFKLKFLSGKSLDLILEPGEKVNIQVNKNELTINGSTGSEKLLQIDKELGKLISFRDSITKEVQQLRNDPQYEQKLTLARDDFFNELQQYRLFLKDFIDKNKHSKAALVALFQQYGRSAYVLSIDEDLEDFEKVIESMKINFPNSPHLSVLEEQVIKLKPLAYGQIAPDFTLPDPNNNNIQLSSFKGKVLLIDFWASWCKPCRVENPKLVKLHETYSKDGFDILSISLDGTQRQREPRKSWLEAIEQDNLSNFNHVSELNGWSTKVRALYNFSSIPYTILLDKEGRISGKNLKGQDLERKIKELLK